MLNYLINWNRVLHVKIHRYEIKIFLLASTDIDNYLNLFHGSLFIGFIRW